MNHHIASALTEQFRLARLEFWPFEVATRFCDIEPLRPHV
jgi:hypothetical protein